MFGEEVLQPLAERFGADAVWDTLFRMLAITSITMVSADSAENPGRKAATKITQICINGKRTSVANANTAIVETFQALLEGNPECAEEFLLQNPGFLTKDAAQMMTRIRPTIQEGMPKAVWQVEPIEFDCTMHPKNPSARVIAMAKNAARNFPRRPLNAVVI